MQRRELFKLPLIAAAALVAAPARASGKCEGDGTPLQFVPKAPRDANPLQDIGATRKIRTVISHGNLYDRVRLDKILADTKAWAAQTKVE